MKRKLKAIKLMELYTLLYHAKLDGVNTADRVKLVRLVMALRPAAEKLQADIDTARERLKPQGFDAALMRWNETREKAQLGDKTGPMTDVEFVEFTYQVLNPYNRDVAAACKQSEQREVTIDVDPLSAEGFDQLVATNAWTAGQQAAIMSIVVAG